MSIFYLIDNISLLYIYSLMINYFITGIACTIMRNNISNNNGVNLKWKYSYFLNVRKKLHTF